MAIKIFITGVTGYIAGDAFATLHEKHPEYEYTALVRSEDKGKQVTKKYPNVKTVIGDLDSSDIISKEAARNDIVLHAADASDHEGAAKAIAKGLLEGHDKNRPGFWLHTGGTGILTYEDSKAGRLGEESDHIYNDLDGVSELTSLPDEAFHRNVDKIVLEAGMKHGDVIKTAIVCPPTIYGEGRGPGSVRGRQVYEMAKIVLESQSIPIVGSGKARWNNVHVHDLSDVYLLLVEAAAAAKLSEEIWGAKGYFIVENDEHSWSDVARQMGRAAEKLQFGQDLKERTIKEPKKEPAGFEVLSWGLNSRAKSGRAQRFLGWQPKACSLYDELPRILEQEHARIQA